MKKIFKILISFSLILSMLPVHSEKIGIYELDDLSHSNTGDLSVCSLISNPSFFIDVDEIKALIKTNFKLDIDTEILEKEFLNLADLCLSQMEDSSQWRYIKTAEPVSTGTTILILLAASLLQSWLDTMKIRSQCRSVCHKRDHAKKCSGKGFSRNRFKSCIEKKLDRCVDKCSDDFAVYIHYRGKF